METPLGMIEPHEKLLKVPPSDQAIYKAMSVENLLRSISGNYLYFNRVDSYKDFPGADQQDGKQLPKDQSGNNDAKFKGNSNATAANYYDQSRERTYACCFSLENSNYIWKNYANGGLKGKVCVVFNFGKLRTMLNQSLQPGNTAVEYNGIRCKQIFSVNYGIVEYVHWNEHQENKERPPNPIRYTYLKDAEKFSDEKELRISLSAFGMGSFVLDDGREMKFPPGLQLAFDFRSAIDNGIIQELLYAPDSDSNYIREELDKLHIAPGKGL